LKIPKRKPGSLTWGGTDITMSSKGQKVKE
jgi:hypothetical protein